VQDSKTRVRIWPIAGVTLDRAGTAPIEGTADQIWFQAVVDRRAETADVNAIASGSQHSTVSAGWPQLPTRSR
jgi:hypothetical protein